MNNTIRGITLALLSALAVGCSGETQDAAKPAPELPGMLDDSRADWRTNFFTDVRRNVEVGSREFDHYAGDSYYYGYTFEVAEGDELEIRVGDDGTGFDAVIGLYGPQRPSGAWGGLLASNDDDPSGGTYDSYLRLDADKGGTYMVIVRDYSYESGDFFVDVACDGGTCANPVDSCLSGGLFCALWCPNGFESDENGCPLCSCADDPLPPIVCNDGDTRPAGDGCNTCTCSGGSWACTEIACLPADECETDADCFETGCSGQLCSAEHMVTTCEFRPEYACYNEPTTSCGCNNGACGWAQTADLLTCLANN